MSYQMGGIRGFRGLVMGPIVPPDMAIHRSIAETVRAVRGVEVCADRRRLTTWPDKTGREKDMKVSELIAQLQLMPQDMEVFTTHEPVCCCGDCFLPADDDWEIKEPLIGTIRNKQVVVI